jgi:CHAT domain-containing protein
MGSILKRSRAVAIWFAFRLGAIALSAMPTLQPAFADEAAIVNAPEAKLNLRDGPNANSNIIIVLSNNTKVHVVNSFPNGWQQIVVDILGDTGAAPADRLSGFVNGSYLITLSAIASSAFRDGRADRQAWETWFEGLSSAYRDGAEFWASRRSDPSPPECTSTSDIAFRSGCEEAKKRLAESDRRRRAEPNYRAGWNSSPDLGTVATAPATPIQASSPPAGQKQAGSAPEERHPAAAADDGSRYAMMWGHEPNVPWVARIDLTSQQYQEEFDKLVGAGYCLTQVNGYAVGDEDRYAAIWKQIDCPPFIARHRLTATEYQELFVSLTGQGYRPKLISGYNRAGADLYAAIFEQSPGPPFVVHYRMTEAEFQREFARLAEKGYCLMNISGYSVEDQARYAAIWEQRDCASLVVRVGLTEEQYHNIPFGFNHYDIKLLQRYRVNNRVLYAIAFDKSPSHRSFTSNFFTADDVRRNIEVHSRVGDFQPLSLIGYDAGPDKPKPFESTVAAVNDSHPQCWTERFLSSYTPKDARDAESIVAELWSDHWKQRKRWTDIFPDFREDQQPGPTTVGFSSGVGEREVELAVEIVGDGYRRSRKFASEMRLYEKAIAETIGGMAEPNFQRPSRIGGSGAGWEYYEAYPSLVEDLLKGGEAELALLTEDKYLRKPSLAHSLAEQSGSPTELDVAQIRQLATETNDTILYYRVSCGDGVDIWVIRPNGEIVLRHGYLPKSRLDPSSPRGMVVAMRGVEAYGSPSVQSLRAQLRAYYQGLFAPIEQYLPKSPEDRVLIVPDKELSPVPFNVLVDARGRYFIDSHTVVFAPSLRVLQLLRKKAHDGPAIDWQNLAPADALIVGNPDMPGYPDFNTISEGGAIRYNPLAKLPGAEAEAQAIGVIFHGSPLIGNAATASRVMHGLQNARLVHFATHGFLDDPLTLAGIAGVSIKEESEFGAVAIAPTVTRPPARENDGIDGGEVLRRGFLTTEAIPRTKADLVVLSACNTFSDIPFDKAGLIDGWLNAGAISMVVTLWSIPDAPTQKLMVRFYQDLQRGLGKAQALRDAMLSVRSDVGDDIRQWSAFELVGGD